MPSPLPCETLPNHTQLPCSPFPEEVMKDSGLRQEKFTGNTNEIREQTVTATILMARAYKREGDLHAKMFTKPGTMKTNVGQTLCVPTLSSCCKPCPPLSGSRNPFLPPSGSEVRGQRITTWTCPHISRFHPLMANARKLILSLGENQDTGLVQGVPVHGSGVRLNDL